MASPQKQQLKSHRLSYLFVWFGGLTFVADSSGGFCFVMVVFGSVLRATVGIYGTHG